jgi:hypothetical protein
MRLSSLFLSLLTVVSVTEAAPKKKADQPTFSRNVIFTLRPQCAARRRLSPRDMGKLQP